MDFEHSNNGSIYYRHWFGKQGVGLPDIPHPIKIIGNDFRSEKTGVHAEVTIAENTTILAYDIFNLGRHDDRLHLANAAYKLFSKPVRVQMTAQEWQHLLDLFCRQAWPAYLDIYKPKMMAGDAANNPLTFLAEPYVIKGGGTILFGPGGSGKSWTCIILAVCIDAGINLFWKTTKCKVLFVNLERSESSVARRLEGVNLALGLEPNRELRTLNARGKSLMDVAEIVEKDVKQEGVELVVLDSLSRAGVGDLNENQPGNKFSDIMNRISPSWLAIGHTGKRDTTSLFGSVMFEAAADVVVRFKSVERVDKLGVALEVTKANDIRNPKPMYLEYSFDGDGIVGIKYAKPSDYPELTIHESSNAADEIYYYLKDEVGQASATSIAKELQKQRSMVAEILAKDKRFTKTKKDGRDQLYGVIAEVSSNG